MANKNKEYTEQYETCALPIYNEKQEIFTQNIRYLTTSLIFMWIIAGRGCRGTGWTALENRRSEEHTSVKAG